jgi:hypothetical protein
VQTARHVGTSHHGKSTAPLLHARLGFAADFWILLVVVVVVVVVVVLLLIRLRLMLEDLSK